MSSESYTPQELMIAVASREIRDHDLVFVGMRLPILAYAVARDNHAPNARGLFEVGLMRDRPAQSYLGTMGDPPNVRGALWSTRMSNVMALMAQGNVDLGFIGGAEVDRFGNLNTSYVGAPSKPQVKLPGSGGGADIAILSRRWVTLMNHEPRRLVDRVSYVTSPGYAGTELWLAKAAWAAGSGPVRDRHHALCLSLSAGWGRGLPRLDPPGPFAPRGARRHGLAGVHFGSCKGDPSSDRI